MSPLLFGSDPEMFAGYEKEGKLFCLPPVFFRKFRGVETMENGRHPIFFKEDDSILHEDGCAFEIALNPSTDWKELFQKINHVKRLAEERILRNFTEDCDGKIHTIPTINYECQRWENMGEEWFMSTTFGCDPDHDAFNTTAKCKVIDARLHPERYGGGHIHISGSSAIKENPIGAIHSLALTAGLAAVAFSDVPSLEKARTFLYGKPGKFRIQNYRQLFNNIPDTNIGVEYRTPSNRWTEKEEIAEKVFHWAKIGITSLLEKNLIAELLPIIQSQVVSAITECNQPLASELLSFVESKV